VSYPPQQPPYGGQPYGAPQPAANDKTQLFGILGIVLGLICCGLLGIVFGILSMNEAKKVGKPNTLGIIAIACGVLNIVGGIVYQVAVRS
jgi:hypothetical protein